MVILGSTAAFEWLPSFFQLADGCQWLDNAKTALENKVVAPASALSLCRREAESSCYPWSLPRSEVALHMWLRVRLSSAVFWEAHFDIDGL